MRVWVALALGLVLVARGGSIALAEVRDTYIKLSASRDILEADGASTTEITASVSTSSGHPVADGTEISFSTDLGQLDPTIATTEGGIARTTLTSDVKEGVATIIATERTNNGEGRLSIEFSAEVGRDTGGWQLMHIKGDWVRYGVDSQVCEAQGNAVFSYRSLRVEANSLSYDVDRSVLKARGNVKAISDVEGGSTWEGEALWMDVSAKIGAIICREERLRTKGFCGSRLDEFAEAGIPSEAFLPIDSIDDRLAIVCRRAVIYPGDKVLCERAKVYVDDQRVLSLPYYFVPLSYGADVLNPKLGVSSSDGLEVDLPFFYAVSEKRVGAVRLMRGSLGEWEAGTGWSLGLEEQYSPRPDDKYIFDLDNITRNDWGLRLNATLQSDMDNSTYFTIGYPRHDYLYFSGTTYKYGDSGSTSFTTYYSKQGGDANADLSGRWRYQTRVEPLPGFSDLRWRGNFDVLYDNRMTLADRTSFLAGFDLLHQGWDLGGGFELTPRLRLGQGIALDGANEHSFLFNLEMDKKLGSNSYFSVRYSYSDTARYDTSYPHSEDLLFNLRWRPTYNFSAYLTSRYDLLSGDYALDANQSYRLNDKWSIYFYQLTQKDNGYSYQDYEVNLQHKLTQGITAMLRWSEARDRVWLELATSQTLF